MKMVNLIEAKSRNQNRINAEREWRGKMMCFFYGFLLSSILALITYVLCEIYWRNIDVRSTTESDSKTCQKRVIAYYNGWAERKITESQLEQLTHVIFDGIKVEKDGKIGYNNNATELKFHEMKHKAKIMNSGVKVMFSAKSHVDDWSTMMRDSNLKKNWISSISSFIVEQELDGVELHYQWPESKAQRRDYLNIARELRYELDKIEKVAGRKAPYIISVFAPCSGWTGKSETILDNIFQYVDFLNVETDDFYASYKRDGLTGALSPLYSSKNHKSVDWTMKDYTCKTQKPSQLNFIVSSRGFSWEKVRNGSDELFTTSEVIGGGAALPWRYLTDFGWDLTKASWHEESQTPYVWDQKNRKLLSFDNYQSLKKKVEYMVFKNLGGVAVHHIELDDDVNTLLNAMASYVEDCPKGMFKKDEIRYNC